MEDDENAGPDDDEAHQQDRARTKELAHDTELPKPEIGSVGQKVNKTI